MIVVLISDWMNSHVCSEKNYKWGDLLMYLFSTVFGWRLLLRVMLFDLSSIIFPALMMWLCMDIPTPLPPPPLCQTSHLDKDLLLTLLFSYVTYRANNTFRTTATNNKSSGSLTQFCLIISGETGELKTNCSQLWCPYHLKKIIKTSKLSELRLALLHI